MLYEYFINSVLLIKSLIFFLIITSFLMIIFWDKLFVIFRMKEYQAVQKIHKGHIPRVGGLIMFASLSFLYFSENKLLNSEAQNFFLDLSNPKLKTPHVVDVLDAR